MGNALHTYSSILFTFSIKPKQDKNVNLAFQSNLPLQIKFHEWHFDSAQNEINTVSNDILSRIV